ncbi:MAG: RluA family pseudouridine synthase [Firmicutes bacterium]|nr:RluA family pseudouridine synthase [Bacillota bacterium]
MKRIFEINKNCTLIEAVSENIAELGKPAIRLLMKAGEARVNGRKQTADCMLKTGDNVSIFMPQRFEAIKTPKVVFVDENILIMDKPAGFDVENNLLSFVKKTYPLALAVHRLDRLTSGLVVFVLNQPAFAALSAAFKQRGLSKVYYAKVNGRVTKQGVYTAYLTKEADKGEVKIFDTAKTNSKKIETQIEIIKAEKDSSILKVGLLTGRTHQIRAHLAHLGHPVFGDNKYGEDAKTGYKDRQYALCAAEISFIALKAPLEYLNGKTFYSTIKILD